jgi:hypothetical protein
MIQIDGEFLVYPDEFAGGIVDFLCKPNRSFIRINLLDVAGASTGTADELASVSPSAVRQFFPIFEFSLVLHAGGHRASRVSHDLRLTQLPLQLSHTPISQCQVCLALDQPFE